MRKIAHVSHCYCLPALSLSNSADRLFSFPLEDRGLPDGVPLLLKEAERPPSILNCSILRDRGPSLKHTETDRKDGKY